MEKIAVDLPVVDCVAEIKIVDGSELKIIDKAKQYVVAAIGLDGVGRVEIKATKKYITFVACELISEAMRLASQDNDHQALKMIMGNVLDVLKG